VDGTLRELADLMRWGPTANNSTPARLVFIRSPEAKARLNPHLSAGNREHTMAAPVTAIVAYDLAFYKHFGKLAPHVDIAKFATAAPEKIEENAFRNSSLQGAYLIIAARALGPACGPMSGFDNPASIANSFPMAKPSRIFCAISAIARRTAHARARHGSISTSSAKFFKRRGQASRARPRSRRRSCTG
jgi:3-hydroxypropanoate dehydrogenase